MNDDDMLAVMRSTLTSIKEAQTDVHLDQPPAVITARARARRVRRGLSGAGAVALAGAAGLALALPGGPAVARPVHVNLDAWSVNTTSSGLVDISIRELSDLALLRQDLAAAGVPAVVTFGEVCTAATGDLPQLEQVLHKQQPAEGSDVVMTVDPAAIPAGSELVIGVAQGGSKQGIAGPGLVAGFGLARDGAPLACHVPHGGKIAGGVKAGIRK